MLWLILFLAISTKFRWRDRNGYDPCTVSGYMGDIIAKDIFEVL